MGARLAKLFALIALTLLLSPAAWAHAVLVEASPADGARVESQPSEIRLRFNEPVSLVAVHVFGPGGGTLQLPAAATASDDGLRIPLPTAERASGTYTVSYRVTSADGHPVTGSLLFGVGVTPDRPDQGKEHPDDTTRLIAAFARALHYGSLLAAAGGALFVILVLPRRSPLAMAARLPTVTGVAAVAVLLNLGLAGVMLTGGSPLALFGLESWWAALTSTSGTSAAIALVGLALLALGLKGERRRLLLAGALVALGALAATGHAATAPPRGVTGPLVLLHGLTAAFWLGALGPLLVVLRHAPGIEAARLVRRFSNYAIVAVTGLVAVGVGLSVLQIVDPAAVAGTEYGRLWLAKMAGVAVLLALATVNRLRLTPALEDGRRAVRERAKRRLILAIGSEMAVMAAVLLLTAGLGTTPPPRALTKPATEYTSVTMVKGRSAVVTISPARPGANSLTLHLAQPDDSPFDPKELTVELSLPAAGIEPITRRPTRSGAGSYRLDGLTLPVADSWEVRIDALIDDFDKAIFRVTLPIIESR